MREIPPNLTDYEKTYHDFKWEIPEYYNFGFDGIDRWAEDREVIGILSEKQGEIIKAFVQLKSTHSPSEKLSREILDYLGRHLESKKRPQELEFIRELPKTITGKIRRSELKNREIEKRKGKG